MKMKDENENKYLNINDPRALEEFGKRIKNARIKKKISQNKLGELLSISRQAVSKWENKKSIPDISIWRKISEVLEVDLSDFVNMVDKTNNKHKKDTVKNLEDKNDDKKTVTEDKSLEDKEIINKETEAINFSINKKTLLIILITLFISLALFMIAIFFIFHKKNESIPKEIVNEWKKINFVSGDEEISFIGYVICDNYKSIYNFENFFYNSPLAGTKKEPVIKNIIVSFYIDNKEVYSYTYEKIPTPLHDFLDNISIALTYEETYIDNSNLVIKLTLTQKNNKKVIRQIEVIPE